MIKYLILFLKCLVPVLVLLLMIMLTGSLITPLFGPEMTGEFTGDSKNMFSGLFYMAVVQALVLCLLASRTVLNKKHLGLFLALVFFVINYLLNVIESLVFLRNIYPVSHQFVNLFNGLLVSLVLGYCVAWLWGPSGKEKEPLPVFKWTKGLVFSWAGWIILWFVIYITAGMLIPMAVPGVYDYYFGASAAMDMSLVPLGYLMQIPRASLWILLAIGIMKFMHGTRLEKSLITGLVFAFIMSSSLLVSNPVMPDLVRLAHLPEILYANMLWGFLLSRQLEKHFKSAPS